MTGWGQPQAQVRYGISGENFPPFGCLTTGDVPRADTLRCVSTDCLNRIWCVNLKDIVPGVGRPGYVAAGASLTQDHVVILISRVPLILADILLIGITWMKLSSQGVLQDIQGYKRLSLPDILFRNGMSELILVYSCGNL